ncbi:MAG: VOC family protein [Pseudomonadota bacterium]
MANGHFIWTDLSTYDMQAAKADYEDIFNWSFDGNDAYDFARAGGQEVAAIFPMPDPLAKMDMPSFWMSYVHVDDLDARVEQARQHDGVIIEVKPQAFGADARIALVRDPSGAGFTLYEGPDITAAASGAGCVVARFHHLPDIKLIEAFYGDMFGWRFVKSSENPWPVYDIRHPDGATIARVEEVPVEIRGKFSYWMPCFQVRSVPETLSQVVKRGGEHFADLPDDRALVADRQGAHFLIQGSGKRQPERGQRAFDAKTSSGPGLAWKAALGLVCVWLAVLLELQIFWAVLFLVWTWPALKTGRADFIEPVERHNRPVLYWSIVGTWIGLSLWLMAFTLIGTG